MILTGPRIHSEWKAGRIDIQPFDPNQLNPNSYDFRLGATLKVYQDDVLDLKGNNPMREFQIPPDGLVLKPGRLYLGHTYEWMGSDYYVPIIRAKSSTARLGIFVHVTSDLIDIGSHNEWTLQLNPIHAVRVYPLMRIGQVTFWKPKGKITLYRGKYQGSRGPYGSLSYKDSDAGEEAK